MLMRLPTVRLNSSITSRQKACGPTMHTSIGMIPFKVRRMCLCAQAHSPMQCLPLARAAGPTARASKELDYIQSLRIVGVRARFIPLPRSRFMECRSMPHVQRAEIT